MNTSYKNKYIKYKEKYLKLKNQTGGSNVILKYEKNEYNCDLVEKNKKLTFWKNSIDKQMGKLNKENDILSIEIDSKIDTVAESILKYDIYNCKKMSLEEKNLNQRYLQLEIEKKEKEKERDTFVMGSKRWGRLDIDIYSLNTDQGIIRLTLYSLYIESSIVKVREGPEKERFNQKLDGLKREADMLGVMSIKYKANNGSVVKNKIRSKLNELENEVHAALKRDKENKQEDDYDSSDDEAKDTLTEDDIALMKEVERIADDKAKRIAKEQRTKREAAAKAKPTVVASTSQTQSRKINLIGVGRFNKYLDPNYKKEYPYFSIDDIFYKVLGYREIGKRGKVTSLDKKKTLNDTKHFYYWVDYDDGSFDTFVSESSMLHEWETELE